MPGVSQVNNLKTGYMPIKYHRNALANNHKIGGSLKAFHMTHNPEIEDEQEYGSNLNKLRQSLKTMHISQPRKTKAAPNKYINF